MNGGVIAAIVLSVIFGVVLLAVASLAGYAGFRLSKLVHALPSGPEHAVSVHECGAGDILLFSGSVVVGDESRDQCGQSVPIEAMLLNAATMLRTGSPWTHIGVVVQNPTTKLLYSFEFTLEPTGGSNHPTSAGAGIGLMPLALRVKSYRGSIYRRKATAAAASVEVWWDAAQELLSSQDKSYKYSFILALWDRVGIPGVPVFVKRGNPEERIKDATQWICTDLVDHMLLLIHTKKQLAADAPTAAAASNPREHALPCDYSNIVSAGRHMNGHINQILLQQYGPEQKIVVDAAE